jgi:hypothetical protein
VRAVALLRARRETVFGEPHHHVADLEVVILYERAKLGKGLDCSTVVLRRMCCFANMSAYSGAAAELLFRATRLHRLLPLADRFK